jgi:hypothetical protein
MDLSRDRQILDVARMEEMINALSCDRVTTDEVWIGNCIYCTLTIRNYKYV